MTTDLLVPGIRIGRLKVVAATPDSLTLAGNMLVSILLLIAGLFLAVVAALLWIALIRGTDTVKVALIVSFLAFLALFIGASTFGARYIFDAASRTLVYTQLFGLRKTTYQAPAISFVSIRTNPASASARECAWLHLMDERELVALYLARTRTTDPSAPALVALADHIADLLDLTRRAEGEPGAASPAFCATFHPYVSQCPNGIQPLREQIV
jgi:hypothetical protein